MTEKNIFEFKNRINLAIIILIIVFPFAFLWQGIDMADTGFHVTNYMFIFNSPETTPFSVWLTNILGGLWLKFAGGLGLIGVNVLQVFISWITVVIFYFMLKDYINKTILLLGLFLALMYSRLFLNVMTYNQMTYLFYSIITLLLFLGLVKDNKFSVLFGGVFVGLSIFIRVPNIVSIIFIISIWFWGILRKKGTIYIIISSIWYVLGILVGILVCLALLYLLGHYNYFISSIKDVIETGASSESSHGLTNLIGNFVINHLFVVGYTILTIITFLMITSIFKLTRRYAHNKLDIIKRIIYITTYMIIGVIVTATFILDGLPKYLRIQYINLTLGILYPVLIFLIFNGFKTYKVKLEYRLASLFALIQLIILPVGSDTGTRPAIFAMWVAVPIFINEIKKLYMFKNIDLSRVHEKLNSNNILYAESVKVYIRLLCSFLLVILLTLGIRVVMFDDPDRWELTSPINNQRVKWMTTTKERADKINSLLGALNPYSTDENLMITYGNIPMFHYLTGIKPYLSTNWPSLGDYTTGKLKNDLAKGQMEKKHLPIIVIAKVDLYTNNWPNGSYSYVENMVNNDPKYKILNNFILANKYTLNFEDECFQIYIPSELKVKS